MNPTQNSDQDDQTPIGDGIYSSGSEMDFISLISQNMLSPAILFFALGIAAGLLKSDLEVPDSISRYLSLYLMMAIGFKGGVEIGRAHV